MIAWTRRRGRRLVPWALAAAVGLGSDLAPAAPAFVDVTVAAGVDYEENDPPGMTGLPTDVPEHMTGGAAAGDFDGDGWPDLYVTRYAQPDILFRNRGDGTFEDVTAAAGLDGFSLVSAGAVWGDVDGDGDLDLYVTAQKDTRHYLFINDGGTFTEEAQARGAAIESSDLHYGFSATFGDYDKDGHLDLHVNEWRMSFYVPPGTRSNVRLLRNLGAANPGHFEDVTESAGVVMDDVPLQFGADGTTTFTTRFSDLDDDGWPDLAIAADFGSSRLFWNDGDGTFTDGTAAAGVGTDENGMGSAIGDYDGDGDLDWFVTSIFETAGQCMCMNGRSGNRLYRNEGNRTFSDQTDAQGVRDGGWGWGAAFFDFDNDGDLDLTMNNGQVWPEQLLPGSSHFNDDQARLWRNDGTTMTDVATASGMTSTGSGKGIVTFDYDRDGDLDVFLTINGGRSVLYRNDGGNDNDWLRIRVRGRESSSHGIGSKVELRATTGSPTQIREIDSGNHFLSQSPSVAHFGLGATGTDPIAEVRVRFPSGKVWHREDVARNQVLVVDEADAVIETDGGAPDAGPPDAGPPDAGAGGASGAAGAMAAGNGGTTPDASLGGAGGSSGSAGSSSVDAGDDAASSASVVTARGGGCGVSGGQPSPHWLFFVALALLFRRRR